MSGKKKRRAVELAKPVAHAKVKGNANKGSAEMGAGIHAQTDPKKLVGGHIKAGRGDATAKWGPDGIRADAKIVGKELGGRIGGRKGDYGGLEGSCHVLKGEAAIEAGRHRVGGKLEGSIAGCEAEGRIGTKDNHLKAKVKAGLGAGAEFGYGCVDKDKDGIPELTARAGAQLGLGIKGNFSSEWLGKRFCPALPKTVPKQSRPKA